jgi:hypothetical protein
MMRSESDKVIITREQWDHSPSVVRGYSKLLEELDNEEFPDCPCSFHIEDVNYDSPNDSVSIISDPVDPVPELSISETSSPSDDSSSYDPWRDADDIPTRPPSAFMLQDFPPLVRCREDPAMGHPEDIIILDMDDDFMTHHWQQLCNSNGGEGIATPEWSRSSSFSCQEAYECKDDDYEKWPVTISSPVINEPAYRTGEVNWTTLSGTHPPEHLSHLI